MGFSKFNSFFLYSLLLTATCQIHSNDDDVSCTLDDGSNSTGVCVIHFLCDANKSVITDGATLIKLRTESIKTLLNPEDADEAVVVSNRPSSSKNKQEGCESLIHTCCKPPNGTDEATQRQSDDDEYVGYTREKEIGGLSVASDVLKSETSGACVFPPYPKHGTYKALQFPNARPGQSRDSFVLSISCRRGFGVVSPGGGDGSGTQQVYCVNGEWLQEMPQCVRFCKLDPHPSVNYVCHIEGAGFRTCQKYVAPGTLVQPTCNGPIYYSAERLSYMKCISGFWDHVAKCKAECGRVTPEGTQLLIDGSPAKRGELPWHAGIYRKTTRPYMQICGGSLITNNLVVSAAHCFWTDVKTVIKSSDFAVAIGKLHRQWDSEEDVGAQKSDIKEIKIPNLFQGEAANFQEDIAVLILSTPFVYKTYVRPVCLNFDANFDRWQLRQDSLGKVAGWGLTSSNGHASQVLQVVELPFINVDICITTLPLSFREYITGDKFCAGYTNGTALCKGDSGGGLSFPGKELGIDRYYLRGIVSAAPSSDGKLCNDEVYTTFTKITKHQDFINEALTSSEAKTCSLYSFQCEDGTCVEPGADCNGIKECPDGSDELDELCVAV